MHKELDHMIERFPLHRKNAIILFQQNEDFNALCIDYWQCMTNLQQLLQNPVKDSRIQHEYKLLSLALEEEALKFLNTPL